jgi:hypothetical protein
VGVRARILVPITRSACDEGLRGVSKAKCDGKDIGGVRECDRRREESIYVQSL